MCLKSLELTGYKTFASKTSFEFAPRITAVVALRSRPGLE